MEIFSGNDGRLEWSMNIQAELIVNSQNEEKEAKNEKLTREVRK